eukprot:1158794-Pelagomonas_calceolata.AAC.2
MTNPLEPSRHRLLVVRTNWLGQTIICKNELASCKDDSVRLLVSSLKRENDTLKTALSGLKAIDDEELARYGRCSCN